MNSNVMALFLSLGLVACSAKPMTATLPQFSDKPAAKAPTQVVRSENTVEDQTIDLPQVVELKIQALADQKADEVPFVQMIKTIKHKSQTANLILTGEIKPLNETQKLVKVTGLKLKLKGVTAWRAKGDSSTDFSNRVICLESSKVCSGQKPNPSAYVKLNSKFWDAANVVNDEFSRQVSVTEAISKNTTKITTSSTVVGTKAEEITLDLYGELFKLDSSVKDWAEWLKANKTIQLNLGAYIAVDSAELELKIEVIEASTVKKLGEDDFSASVDSQPQE